MPCLCCNCEEKGYQPDTREVDYVCSTCVTILSKASPALVNQAYEKAVAKGLDRKATALSMFIQPMEEKQNDRTKHRNLQRPGDGNRGREFFRSDKRTTARTQAQTRIALCENQQELPPVFRK